MLTTSGLPADEPTGLSPELTSRLGEMLDRDWQTRPQWADMAVGILKGGNVGSGSGWFTASERRHDWTWLAATFSDAGNDQRIERGEIAHLSDQDFDAIDRDRNGVITQRDFQFSKNPLLEDETSASAVFVRLDYDSNGRLTMDELTRWFDRSAGESDFLTVKDLQDSLQLLPVHRGSKPAGDFDPRWQMLTLLLSGDMGSFAEGPDLGDSAPELELPLVAHDDEGTELELTDRFVSLADARGKKPVVLIFGSFT